MVVEGSDGWVPSPKVVCEFGNHGSLKCYEVGAGVKLQKSFVLSIKGAALFVQCFQESFSTVESLDVSDGNVYPDRKQFIDGFTNYKYGCWAQIFPPEVP